MNSKKIAKYVLPFALLGVSLAVLDRGNFTTTLQQEYISPLWNHISGKETKRQREEEKREREKDRLERKILEEEKRTEELLREQRRVQRELERDQEWRALLTDNRKKLEVLEKEIHQKESLEKGKKAKHKKNLVGKLERWLKKKGKKGQKKKFIVRLGSWLLLPFKLLGWIILGIVKLLFFLIPILFNTPNILIGLGILLFVYFLYRIGVFALLGHVWEFLKKIYHKLEEFFPALTYLKNKLTCLVEKLDKIFPWLKILGKKFQVLGEKLARFSKMDDLFEKIKELLLGKKKKNNPKKEAHNYPPLKKQTKAQLRILKLPTRIERIRKPPYSKKENPTKGSSYLNPKKGVKRIGAPNTSLLQVRTGLSIQKTGEGNPLINPCYQDQGHRKQGIYDKEKKEQLVRDLKQDIKVRLPQEKPLQLKKAEKEQKKHSLNKKKDSTFLAETEDTAKSRTHSSGSLGEQKILKKYLEKAEVDHQDYDRYCDLFHVPSIIFRQMRINEKNPIYFSTQEHFSHNLKKGKEVEVEIRKNGKFFVESKECTFRHQGWTIEELKKDMIPMLNRYLCNIGWKNGFSWEWKGTNLLCIKLAGNGLSNFRKSADYERTNYLPLFEKESYVDLLSECRYNIQIEHNRVPSFKKMSEVEGNCPKIEGKYLLTDKSVYSLFPFKKLNIKGIYPEIHGNYLITSQRIYKLSPFGKIGHIKGFYPIINGNYLITQKGAYNLSPFKKLGNIKGYYHNSKIRIQGNYFLIDKKAYSLSPFGELGKFEGDSPKINGNYLTTNKTAYTLSPFKDLYKELGIEGYYPKIKGNYLVTDKVVYILSPFKKLPIEGYNPKIIGNYLIINNKVCSLSTLDELGKFEGDSPKINGNYLTTDIKAYTLSPFKDLYKELGIEGSDPIIRGNYLVTDKAVYILSPFKKLGKVEGYNPIIRGNCLITSKAVYTLSPFKKLGKVEGYNPIITANYLITSKAVYTLSPFKKLGKIEGYYFFSKTQVQGNYFLIDKKVYSLSPFGELGKIEGSDPIIRGNYLITDDKSYSLSPFKELDIKGEEIQENYLVTKRAIYVKDRLNPKKPTAPYLSLRQRFTALGALLVGKEVNYTQYEMYDTPSMRGKKFNRTKKYSQKKSQRKEWLLPHFKEEEINTKWLQEDIVRGKEGNIYRRENFPKLLKELICCQYLAGHGAENHQLVLGTSRCLPLYLPSFIPSSS